MRKCLVKFVVCGIALFFFAGCLAEGLSIKADKIDTKVGSAEGIGANADKIDTKGGGEAGSLMSPR